MSQPRWTNIGDLFGVFGIAVLAIVIGLIVRALLNEFWTGQEADDDDET
jgi:hypothetical protein